MVTDTQRKQWKTEMMKDYPSTDPYFIDLVLDLYAHDPEYIKKLSKKKFKPIDNKIPDEIKGVVSVVGSDTEEAKKWFHEPIHIPDPEEDNKITITEQ